MGRDWHERSSRRLLRVSIHAPRVGRDDLAERLHCARRVSIHAARGGRDPVPVMNGSAPSLFQPTRPAWGATAAQPSPSARSIRFNPRAPRGARRLPHVARDRRRRVSIHAPRVGRDRCLPPSTSWSRCFNPRAPRGARHGQHDNPERTDAVSIHAPRVGRDVGHGQCCRLLPRVSIHAPRVGRDIAGRPELAPAVVSIHAPRVGRDWNVSYFKCAGLGFNPRAPRGARRRNNRRRPHRPCFNPRAPRGARRIARRNTALLQHVSIHAPRVGRDRDLAAILAAGPSFNPRAPRGARRQPP